MLLFLVAAGLSLIFGTLKVINFMHGSLYMLGAYFAFTDLQRYGQLHARGARGRARRRAVRPAVRTAVHEPRVRHRRPHAVAGVLQLHPHPDDAVKIIWGAEFRSMGMPAAFQRPPLIVAGGVLPVFYLFLIGVTTLVALALGLVITRTRIGKIVRAAAVNPTMTSALGINTTLVYGGVFALGSLLAGLAGALAVPVRSLVAGMGFSILIESFIVTVIGGMGSVAGALVGALLIGLVRSFGSIGFPLFTDGLMFLFMTIILITRPSGLFGKEL